MYNFKNVCIEARIKAMYPLSHGNILATRNDIFQRAANLSTLEKNGLVVGYLNSVETEYPTLEPNLKELVQHKKEGVEPIFSKIISSKGNLITLNSTTRYMARIGPLEKPLQRSIPLLKTFVAS